MFLSSIDSDSTTLWVTILGAVPAVKLPMQQICLYIFGAPSPFIKALSTINTCFDFSRKSSVKKSYLDTIPWPIKHQAPCQRILLCSQYWHTWSMWVTEGREDLQLITDPIDSHLNPIGVYLSPPRHFLTATEIKKNLVGSASVLYIPFSCVFMASIHQNVTARTALPCECKVLFILFLIFHSREWLVPQHHYRAHCEARCFWLSKWIGAIW